MDVKTLCLGALTMGDATGYEIRKLFEEGPFSQFFDASYGSIYPALNRLLQERLVTVTQFAQEKRPDKKVYSLAPAGMTAFKQALAVPPTRDRIRSEHVVRLFFADLMSEDDLAATYQSYLSHFQTQADHLRGLDLEKASNGRQFACGLGLKFYESMVDYLTENRDQLFDKTTSVADTADAGAQGQQGSGDD